MDQAEHYFNRAKTEMGPAIKTALARFVAETDRPDVEAEILASIWTAIQGFENNSSLKTYLYPVIRRRIADYFRKRYREAKLMKTVTTELKERVEGLPPKELDAITLSPAELRVLRCVAFGATNEEICEALHVSIDTIRTHMKHIYKKTTAKNRPRLVLLAHRFWREEK